MSNEHLSHAQPLTVVNVVTDDRVEHPWGLGHVSTSLQRVGGPAEHSYNVSVTTRLSVTSQPSVSAVHDLLDEAHHRSVDLFLRSTTSTAHTKWKGPR